MNRKKRTTAAKKAVADEGNFQPMEKEEVLAVVSDMIEHLHPNDQNFVIEELVKQNAVARQIDLERAAKSELDARNAKHSAAERAIHSLSFSDSGDKAVRKYLALNSN